MGQGLQQALEHHVSREGVMQPSHIADAIMFLRCLPRRANVSQMLIRPADETKLF